MIAGKSSDRAHGRPRSDGACAHRRRDGDDEHGGKTNGGGLDR